MKKLKLLLIVILLGYTSTSWAQSKVSGVVTDDENVPLPGASILIKGTAVGVVTDIDGNYSLNVPGQNSVLVFSFVGFNSEEVTVGTQSVINLAMVPDITSMEEIVVIGYGEVEKKDVTGAIGSVATEDIVRANPVQAAKAIQGQVAGVIVSKQNSRPGAGYDINIRGLSSIDYSNEPLVVIDGVMGGDMNALNPSDIESMDILKDASSTAIYGSRGANGVILITTKRGTKGKPVVSYSGYVGVKTPAHLPDMMNAQQFYKASVTDHELNGGTPMTFTSTELDMVNSGKSTDWLDEISGPAMQTNHSISVGGGSDNTNYHFSAGYLNEGGNLDNTKFQRYNIKGSMDSKVTDFLKIGFTANYSNTKREVGSNEALRSAYRARPTGVPYYDDILNPDENQDFEWNGYAAWMGINDKQVLNPLIESDPYNFQDETRGNNFFGNAYIELMPIEGLSIKSSLSASVNNSRFGQFRGTMTKDRKTTLLPRSFRQTDDISNYTLDNIITYKKEVGDHDFTITGAQSSFQERNEEMDSYVDEIPYNSLWYAYGTGRPAELTTKLTERSLLSYMGRVIYGFKSKYILTLTSRWDGASQLSEGNKWDFFPSAAVAWRLGEENFIQNIDAISDMKLRVSYGLVGNSAVDPYSTQAKLINTPYDFDGSPAFGFAPENLADRNLKWEKSKELNIGIDMGFLNNRISASLEVYSRKTVDLIYNEQIPTSTGFEEIATNVGEVANRGVELSLNTVNIVKNKFKWTTSINFSRNVNEVLSIGTAGLQQDIATGLFVGHPISAHYDYEFDGIWQLDEAAAAAEYDQVPGSVKVVDQNDDGMISSNEDIDDRTVLGSEQPDWTMGITNKLTYGNFDLSFLIYTSQGATYRNSMLSGTMGEVGTGRYNALNMNYWTVDNPSNEYYGPGIASNPYRGAIFYQDASFVRISDITFGYTLPRTALEKFGFSNFRVYAQVTNPFVFHDFDGMDPEFNTSTYNDGIPSATYLVGLNFSF
ncbi:MAG: TonB-dependent receptor [Reichenbachiella sp.]|uniref:SusC/RagA family TonB-linked outer membrane protein n=1 Tax=Reichenbachiella sp. TaxID=2184521 RepID=UPI0032995920